MQSGFVPLSPSLQGDLSCHCTSYCSWLRQLSASVFCSSLPLVSLWLREGERIAAPKPWVGVPLPSSYSTLVFVSTDRCYLQLSSFVKSSEPELGPMNGSLLPQEIWGSVPASLCAQQFCQPWTKNFALHAFLFRGTLRDTYWRFLNIERTTNGAVTHAWRKLMSHMHFLSEAHGSLLALGNMRQYYSTTLGGHFKQKNRQQKHRNMKNMSLSRLWKGHLFTVRGPKKRAECHLVHSGSCTSVTTFCTSLWITDSTEFKSTNKF